MSDQQGQAVALLAGRGFLGPVAYAIEQPLPSPLLATPADCSPETPWLFVIPYEVLAALEAPAVARANTMPIISVRARRIPYPSTHLTTLATCPIASPTASDRDQHLARVAAAIEDIRDGTYYQANLAHRLAVQPCSREQARAFFLQRTQTSAPPCAAYLELPHGTLISLSPERYVEVDVVERTIATFPIKGTRRRSLDAAQDQAAREALCASEKDRAEHAMIVDLMRNDLGKVAAPGQVSVSRLMSVLSVPTVHHLESEVRARLSDDVDIPSVLRALGAGGSVTGAPKSSAVEAIRRLEPVERGYYTGVLGVFDGVRLRTSLLIRTWWCPIAGEGALHVGGGIVAHSDPEDEWRETETKSRAFLI